MRTHWFILSRLFLTIPTAYALSSCAGTTTQQAALPPGAVKAEQEKQRELVLSENAQQQARLDEVTYPLLARAVSLCEQDLGYRLGLRIGTIYDYPSDLRTVAAAALGINDTLTILSLPSSGPAARAGLISGDRLIAVGETAIQQGSGAGKHFTKLVGENASAAHELPVMVQRGAARRRFNVRAEEVCDYGAVVVNDPELNAYADGKAIYVTSTMMRFVNDDELGVVAAHEFAHNAMGHIKAKKKNSLFGAIVGALGDIAMASRGVNTGGYYTNQGAKLGAMTFSQDFEREADYVGIYALALAARPVAGAPTFWRRMAIADPKAIRFASSHPTTAERFVRLEQAIYEVDQKIALRQPLKPNSAGPSKPQQQPEYDLAGVGNNSVLGGTRNTGAAVVARQQDLAPRDTSMGSVQGYSEYVWPKPVPANAVGVSSPGQPTPDTGAIPRTDTNFLDTPLQDSSVAEVGDWLGQPHGRVYYWADCEAARELPEPIYFKSEEDAERIGYRRSLVPGC